ncbi:hypothetical protein VNO80_06717 [Phaseolus coccineus]|uniref:Uncharacterized protein n=1 Tax=Phaseolus coccineus TaxID=3886 RepID=A0AAN9NIT6_PHACN
MLRALAMPACLYRPGDVRIPRALAMSAYLAPWRCPYIRYHKSRFNASYNKMAMLGRSAFTISSSRATVESRVGDGKFSLCMTASIAVWDRPQREAEGDSSTDGAVRKFRTPHFSQRYSRIILVSTTPVPTILSEPGASLARPPFFGRASETFQPEGSLQLDSGRLLLHRVIHFLAHVGWLSGVSTRDFTTAGSNPIIIGCWPH